MIKVLTCAVKSLVSADSPSAAALQSLATKLLVIALNAFCSISVARTLHPEGRGEMAAIIMWPGFLSTLLTLGLPSSLTFNLRRSPSQTKVFVGSSLILASFIAAAVALIGFLFIPAWLQRYPAEEVRCAQWFLLSSPVPIFLLVGRYSLEAHNRFSESNTTLWLAPSLTACALSLLALFKKLTPVTGGIAYLAAGIPVLIWMLFVVYKSYRPSAAFYPKVYSALFGYGIRCWGIDLLSALSGQADQVFVVRFLTPNDMGTYAVVAGLARMLGVFESSASMVLFPRIAAKAPAEVLAVTGKVLRATLACTLLFTFPAAIFGPSLLAFIYGPEYVGQGALVLRILLANVVISGATQILAQSFMALSRPGVITVIQALGLATILPLMYFLIPRYGIVGAGVAMLSSTSLRFLCTLFSYRPLLQISSPAVFPNTADLAFIKARLEIMMFPATKATS